jgi:hypothetical protein
VKIPVPPVCPACLIPQKKRVLFPLLWRFLLDQPLKPAARESRKQETGVRVGVIAERRYLAQAQPRGMMAALEARGTEVVLIDPEGGCYEPGGNGWLAGLDVVIARGRSWGVLCLLSWVEAQGVPVINSRSSIAAVHNKADMAVALGLGHSHPAHLGRWTCPPC